MPFVAESIAAVATAQGREGGHRACQAPLSVCWLITANANQSRGTPTTSRSASDAQQGA
jgi:hypothetical protein